MENFGFLPDGTPTYADSLDAEYPHYTGASATAQYRIPGQPGQPYRPSNQARQRPPAGERIAAGHPPQDPRRGYPPARGGSRPTSPPGGQATRTQSGPQPAYRPEGYRGEGYRADSGPMPAHRPDSGPMPAYRAESGPMPTYRPDSRPMPAHRQNSGPMPAYRPDSGPMPAYRADSGPMPAYRADGYRAESGPMPAHRQDSGPMRAFRPDSGPMPGYQPDSGPERDQRRATTTLIADYPPVSASGPMPVYRAPEEMPAVREMPSVRDLPPGGRRVAGWLPFSNRLILLPKTGSTAGEELREHRDVNGGWLRPAVFGAMDGLVTNSSLIAGIGGGGGGHGMIVLTGIAGLIAGAFSMATGEYISVTSQNELTTAEVNLERKQHARDPHGKRSRLTQLYVEKGVSPNLAEAVVRQISADPERAVATHVREELGIDPDDLPSPRTAAVASFASFTLGALIPLAPFLAGYPDLNAALAIAGLSAFAGGAAVAKLTGRSSLLGGLRQFTAAFLATGFAFVIGHMVGAHIS